MNNIVTKRIAVCKKVDSNDILLAGIADRLQIPIVTSFTDDYDFYFVMVDDLLYLQCEDIKICVDFSSGGATYRREFGGGKNQSIGRAIGVNKKKNLSILDATAGLGGDSFVLACLGCSVTLLERSPIISSLLEDGIRRGLLDENIASIIHNMEVINVEAGQYFLDIVKKPDVIYLDPMYPHRKKSAKVKKEMQVLQKLLGHDQDTSFLALARKTALSRVVVKRPKGAEFLNESAPTHSIDSKKTRYDVYMCSN